MYCATRPGGANSEAYSRKRADQSASPIEKITRYVIRRVRLGPPVSRNVGAALTKVPMTIIV